MEYRFPTSIEFDLVGKELRVNYKSGRPSEPEIDIWAIAYALFGQKVSKPIDTINIKISDNKKQYYNSLVLRLYFWKEIIHGMRFKINDSDQYLYDAKNIINSIINKTSDYLTYDENIKIKLGKRNTKIKRTSESSVEKTLSDNKLWDIMQDKPKRQWPANIFKGEISKESMMMRKRWIDMVGIDKDFSLSAIEIKAGNNLPLDLFAQNFDYMIYLHLFKEHILNKFFAKHTSKALAKPICGYFVAERFHPLLKKLLPFIKTETKLFIFKFLEYDSKDRDVAFYISPVFQFLPQ